MCLFSRPEYDVEFANRPRPRRKKVVRTSYVPERRVSETIITERHEERPAQYVPAPRASTPVIRPVTPPAPPPVRLELVSVEESRTSPRASRVSMRGRDAVVVERDRIVERVVQAPAPPKLEYETYRYVPGAGGAPEGDGRRRSRSITYETNPRLSGRVVERERERVVVDEGGRRREYYRRP